MLDIVIDGVELMDSEDVGAELVAMPHASSPDTTDAPSAVTNTRAATTTRALNPAVDGIFIFPLPI
jgi:hypothetical protein